eukprot:gene31341-7290_t
MDGAIIFASFIQRRVVACAPLSVKVLGRTLAAAPRGGARATHATRPTATAGGPATTEKTSRLESGPRLLSVTR